MHDARTPSTNAQPITPWYCLVPLRDGEDPWHVAPADFGPSIAPPVRPGSPLTGSRFVSSDPRDGSGGYGFVADSEPDRSKISAPRDAMT